MPGVSAFLHYEDPNPISISYIAISTRFGSVGVWEFSNIPGMSYFKMYLYNYYFVSVVRLHYLLLNLGK